MSDLYEQLKDSLGDQFSTMAMLGAPYMVRKIINLMLRNRGAVSYPKLLDALADFPDDKRSDQAELDETLDVLCRLGWLERQEKDEKIVYAVITSKNG